MTPVRMAIAMHDNTKATVRWPRWILTAAAAVMPALVNSISAPVRVSRHAPAACTSALPATAA